MGIFKMAMFSSTLNLDVCAASLYLGTFLSRQMIIPVISGILAVLQCIVFSLGYGLGALLGSILGGISHIAGAGLLICIGIYLLKESHHHHSSWGKPNNILLVFLGTGTDTLMAGIGIGAMGGLLLGAFLLIFFFASILLNALALYLGRWLRNSVAFPTEIVTGVVLIVLGIGDLLGMG